MIGLEFMCMIVSPYDVFRMKLWVCLKRQIYCQKNWLLYWPRCLRAATFTDNAWKAMCMAKFSTVNRAWWIGFKELKFIQSSDQNLILFHLAFDRYFQTWFDGFPIPGDSYMTNPRKCWKIGSLGPKIFAMMDDALIKFVFVGFASCIGLVQAWNFFLLGL